jgi:transcriptional regulator with XRE-family HTH domain
MRNEFVNRRKPLTSAQLRAARALLRWSAEDLARYSALGVTTIRRAELTESETSLTAANDQAVRRALEVAGSGVHRRALRNGPSFCGVRTTTTF